MSTELGYQGPQGPNSHTSDYNAQLFVIQQVLSAISTAKLVQIQSVTNSGGVSPVGFVDVLPLVNQLDGSSNAVPHGVVHNIPYFRLQGGTDAVILDPKVGDIGICVFSDRDISAVKNTKAVANPGSKRRFDMADGLYIGGVLNGAPVQYMQFSSAGINVVSPTKITLQAPLVEIDASTSLTVNSPQSGFSGMVIVQGLLSWLGGMTGSAVSGISSFISGAVQFVGSITSNGRAIDSAHTHTAQGANAVTTPPN
jgi:phage baseplate assembly protein gpV